MRKNIIRHETETTNRLPLKYLYNTDKKNKNQEGLAIRTIFRVFLLVKEWEDRRILTGIWYLG